MDETESIFEVGSIGRTRELSKDISCGKKELMPVLPVSMLCLYLKYRNLFAM
jgi:hypothetical protein